MRQMVTTKVSAAGNLSECPDDDCLLRVSVAISSSASEYRDHAKKVAKDYKTLENRKYLTPTGTCGMTARNWDRYGYVAVYRLYRRIRMNVVLRG